MAHLDLWIEPWRPSLLTMKPQRHPLLKIETNIIDKHLDFECFM